MERLLLDCDEDAFGEDDWPGRGGGDVRETVSGSSGSGSSGGAGSSGSESVYFTNCTAAREAGAASVHVGDPCYASHLDRDGDGVGCE